MKLLKFIATAALLVLLSFAVGVTVTAVRSVTHTAYLP